MQASAPALQLLLNYVLLSAVYGQSAVRRLRMYVATDSLNLTITYHTVKPYYTSLIQ